MSTHSAIRLEIMLKFDGLKLTEPDMLITLAPLVLFLYALHLLFVKIIFDIEVFSNFFRRFPTNLIRNGNACIIQEFGDVEKVGGENNLKKGTLVNF